ncbi:MAG: cystathionine gamma-synthase [Ignavibacteriae bacterium]|nr:MAG: cystathionine gamma-synthase [Ignavibacteriota bacterium]
MGFSTDAIHAGQKPDEGTGAVVTAIQMTSTYAQEELGKNKGYDYSRVNNLTRESMEKNIAVLEKGKYGIAFGSGIAAIHSVLSLVKSGEHVIATENLYGGSYRLFQDIFSENGIEFTWVNTNEIVQLKSALKKNTKMIYVETPTNPTLSLTDIKAVSSFAKKNNLIAVVDNTFMSPYFQNPLELGADIVVHSSSKYLGGHSDIISGIVIVNDDELKNKIKFFQKAIGAIPSPFDCWLILRSTKTLSLRMKQHNENALKIAEFLEKQQYVKRVYYPGLKAHAQHKLAKKQMRGFGGVVTVDFTNLKTAKKFISKTKLFTLAESLGGVETLISHPATMSHASYSKKRRLECGITDSLIRISVGIEDVEDLIADIKQAIK